MSQQSSRPLRILFLCTGNSARSILGEYLLRHLGAGRFETFSAGAAPTGRVHPLALATLGETYGIEAKDARSKSISDLAGVEPDVVITVCDHARDACPIWPGGALQVHWGLPDPAAVEGSEEERREALRSTAAVLHRQLERLCSRPGVSDDAEVFADVAGELTPPA